MQHIYWRGTWSGLSPAGLSHQRAREVLRSTGGIVRGKFPSRKTGRMVHYEGLLELDALYLFETSPLIACYTEQPVRIYYPDGARLRRYTPDFQLSLADGQEVLIEVKPAANAAHPDTRHSLAQIAAHFSRAGQAFEVLTDAVIRIEPRLSNVKVIHHEAARIRPELLKGEVSLRRLAANFPMEIHAAQAALSAFSLDPYSLLLAGQLVCDLSMPVGTNTLLNLNLENGHEWFRLSHRHHF